MRGKFLDKPGLAIETDEIDIKDEGRVGWDLWR